MTIKGTLGAAIVAGTLAAGTAGAQINYTTQGFFSGPGSVACTTVAALTASCTGSGFSLLFTGTAGVNLANNTITSLGSFALTGTGTVTAPPGVLNFTLLVNQTTPTSGQGIFLGAITGQVNTVGGNFSSLIWTPNSTTNIGATNYQLVFDNVGPAAGVGLGIPINNVRGIDALVRTTATPEPGTITLMVTGLAGLVPIVVRRRKKNATL